MQSVCHGGRGGTAKSAPLGGGGDDSRWTLPIYCGRMTATGSNPDKRSRQLELPGSIEPLVSRVRRVLWMHSRIREMLLGEANGAFGNNAA